jgi:monoamine oxidase
VHGEQARRYCTMSAEEVREATYAGLEQLFPGIRAHLTFAEVFQYPTAVAYWPVEQGRSRFDALAQALRQPHGRVLVGGDTTENSHSEGAIIAGQRMARQVAPLAEGPVTR